MKENLIGCTTFMHFLFSYYKHFIQDYTTVSLGQALEKELFFICIVLDKDFFVSSQPLLLCL